MKTTFDKVLGYTSVLFIPVLFASAQPAMADSCDYSITRYSAPMSRTIRTYSVSAPTSSVGTTYISTPTPVVERVITKPVLIEKPVVPDSVYVEKTIRQPVLIQQPPVMVERTTTAPVVIENKPVRVKKDSHHLLNFGVWPLKLKVL